MKSNQKFVVITGAGKGLGKAFARYCAELGYNLILLTLPGENAQQLGLQLQYRFQINVSVFEIDLTNIELLKNTLADINRKYQIFFLINNAGMGGSISILNASEEYLEQIVQLNIKSTVIITKSLLSNLIKSGQGYILNVASMAAFAPIAYKTIYPATKSFISSFSLSLHEELRAQNINVSITYPGAIMTNFNVAKRIMNQGSKGRLGLITTDEIAKCSIDATLRGKRKIIPGFWNRISAQLISILPTYISLKLISSSVKRELKTSF